MPETPETPEKSEQIPELSPDLPPTPLTKSDETKCPNLILSGYYSVLHIILMVLCTLTLTFCTNVIILTSLLVILLIDGISNVFFKNCILTIYEDRYSSSNGITNSFRIFMNSLQIGYERKNVYESQLETIVNVWCMTAFKILSLGLMNTRFN